MEILSGFVVTVKTSLNIFQRPYHKEVYNLVKVMYGFGLTIKKFLYWNSFVFGCDCWLLWVYLRYFMVNCWF